MRGQAPGEHSAQRLGQRASVGGNLERRAIHPRNHLGQGLNRVVSAVSANDPEQLGQDSDALSGWPGDELRLR